jgi:Protein of unknown function (DUF402)
LSNMTARALATRREDVGGAADTNARAPARDHDSSESEQPERPFDTGTPVLLRNFAMGRVRYLEPAIVVRDALDRRLLFRPPGTPINMPSSYAVRDDVPKREQTSRRALTPRDWHLLDTTWGGSIVLIDSRPADWYSVWMFWEPYTYRFLRYYVDFEAPWTRTALGFDTTDLCLDLVVDADLSPHWKDRDGFEARISSGLIAASHAAEVRRASEIVLARVTAQEPPFSQDMREWEPEPLWGIPTGGEAADRAP